LDRRGAKKGPTESELGGVPAREGKKKERLGGARGGDIKVFEK